MGVWVADKVFKHIPIAVYGKSLCMLPHCFGDSAIKYFLDLLCAKIGKIAVIIIYYHRGMLCIIYHSPISILLATNIGNLSTVFTVFGGFLVHI